MLHPSCKHRAGNHQVNVLAYQICPLKCNKAVRNEGTQENLGKDVCVADPHTLSLAFDECRLEGTGCPAAKTRV